MKNREVEDQLKWYKNIDRICPSNPGVCWYKDHFQLEKKGLVDLKMKQKLSMETN